MSLLLAKPHITEHHTSIFKPHKVSFIKQELLAAEYYVRHGKFKLVNLELVSERAVNKDA